MISPGLIDAPAIAVANLTTSVVIPFAKPVPSMFGKGHPQPGRRDSAKAKERGKGRVKGEPKGKGPLAERGKGNPINETLAPGFPIAMRARQLPAMGSATTGQEGMVTASMAPIAISSMRDLRVGRSVKTLSLLYSLQATRRKHERKSSLS
jgi:hypothetical protein